MSRITILEKDGKFAAIGLLEVESDDLPLRGIASTFDMRRPEIYREGYASRGEVNEAFNKAVATSYERGWSVAFAGTALNHPIFS